jgi:hypothetical protein
LTQKPKETTRLTPIERPLIVLLVLCLSSILLHAGAQGVPDARAVTLGRWGGEHIVLEISVKGAEVEFDCAHGQVTQPITVDKHGDFDVAGTFTPDHSGPVRRDEDPPQVPARYSGHVDGQIMSLTVILGEEKLGFFTLTRGSASNLRKCR